MLEFLQVLPRASKYFGWVLAMLVALPGTAPVRAHDLPLSYVDLRAHKTGVDITVEASANNLAHELSGIKEEVLLTPAGALAQKDKLRDLVFSRFRLSAHGEKIQVDFLSIEPLPERGDVRLLFRGKWKREQEPDALQINCRLFPYDLRHKTFLNLYQNGKLERQEIFDNTVTRLDVQLKGAGSAQSTLTVIGQFLREGVHHIFIGPDHILFIIGLLLLGGSLRQLLKIVTAFTLAHSITLALATLEIWNPPSRVIEPLIALSIVFVGLHTSYTLIKAKDAGAEKARPERDLRLLFAFVFGFIHGFGFASVLRELNLPSNALGLSLFAFNGGVEFGQACIVLTVAPLLALSYKRSRVLGWRVASVASLAVISMGAFWFIQRVSSAV